MMRVVGVSLASMLVLVVLGCSPKAVRRQTTPGERTRVTTFQGDTVAYLVEFSNRTDRDRFLGTFRNFLRQYPFASVQSDSGPQYVLVRLMPLLDSAGVPESVEFSPVERSSFIEDVIEGAAAALTSPTAMPVDTVKVKVGGSARLYLERGAFDPPFSPLVQAYPFRRNGQAAVSDSVQPYLSVVDSSQRKIVLRIEGKITNCAGQVLSALDFIDQWTGLVRNSPAEGLALFRHVDGIIPFIKGEEAVIRGFGATDGSTIQIRLSGSDPDALNRLRSSRLLWSGFRLGPYCIGGRTETTMALAPNGHFAGGKPLLDQLAVNFGGETNPILSFSLGKFDAMTVTSTGDLEYARRTLLKSASLIPASHDRYFISCVLRDQPARAYVESIVNPEDILRNFVKAEGKLISALENDGLRNDGVVPEAALQPPPKGEPLKILYRADDPVSKVIAEKLMADFTHAGLQCALKGGDKKRYESALVARDYGCAVGWVPETVVADTSEKLRLAAIWFADQKDEQARLAQYFEIPLFSVDKYLLMKSRLHLQHGRVAGLSVREE